MVSVLTWVLVGILLYTLVAMALQSRNLLPAAVNVSGPITTLRTKRGRIFLDRLSRPRRFWRAVSNFGVGVALVVMVGSALMIALSVLLFIQQPESAQIRDPQNYLAIPGLNAFLPMSAAPPILAGLAIGMVVHEGGHGLLCRVEDIDIDSMGLAFFTIIPIGAFVEPDEESQERADRGGKVRMFAAGVTANFIVTIVAYVLLFGPVVGAIAVAPGVPVGSALSGSAVDSAGIGHGDVVQQVEGVAVANQSDLDDRLQGIDDPNVSVTLKSGETVPVDRHLVVTRTVPSIEEGLNVESLPKIERVNDTRVYTEADLDAAMANHTVVELVTDRGTTTFPAGAYVAQVAEGGPLADAGVPTNGSVVVITRLGDERVVDAASLVDTLESYESGEQVTVEAYVDGQRRTYEVELGTADDGGPLVGAAQLSTGYGGLVAEDFGVDPYPAETFLDNIGGASPGPGLLDGNFFGFLLFALFAPLASILGANYNFAGFVGGVSNFYVVDGPLAILGGGVVFALANLLFWTGWVNLNLGVFNCFPAFPLDGGHIFRNGVESVVSRLPVENRRQLATVITTLTTVTMIALFLVMVFGPSLIG